MKQLFSISHTLKLSVVGAIFVVCNNTVWSQSVSTTVIASPAISAAPATSVFSNVSAGSTTTAQAAGAPAPTVAQPINLGDVKASAKGGDASLPADAKGADATLPADAKSAAEDAQLNADPRKIAAASEIEFQRFVRSATGQSLGLFGFELFGHRNSFSSVQGASVPAGYVFGPGDELMVQVNGLVELSQRFVIDRDGRVMVPRVGPLVLAGVQFADAEKVLTAHIGKVYRNFSVSVTMGRLRSIEVFVVGQARAPGKHLVSSLSSLINALFETGGPSSNGSLRAIELRRQGKTISTVDMYAFLSKGDNTGDVKLLAGDVIYVPPAGPRAALLGTINHPAIYELLPTDTINSVLALTGGLPTLAAPQKAQLERVESSRDVARYVEDFALDAKGMALPLKAGDILTVFQISPQIANVVTLQGNVASPLRYSFKPGMRVSDLLQDKRLLIPSGYWQQINQGATTGNYSRPEVNLDYATIQRLDPITLRTTVVAFNLGKAVAQDPTENLALVTGDIVTIYGPNAAGTETENSITITGEVVGGTKRFVWRKGFTIKDIIPSSQWLIDYYSYWQRPSGRSLTNDINWDYAQVIRRIPSTLGSQAITFNLGRAVLQGSPADNIALEPGDQISLFTTAQLAQPTERRTMLVNVSGEVAVPGVYQVKSGETLPQLLKRIGGLMPQAYVFGIQFTRESVRARQQENLDTLVRRLEAQMQSQQSQQTSSNIAAFSDKTSAAALIQGQQAQTKAQLDRLRSFKSNGRLSLELDPQGNSLSALPSLPLEDGDRITIPVTPGFVTAFGSVNNENAVIYKPGKTVGDVVKSAGFTEDAEADQAFVLRADGTIFAKRDSGGFFGGSFEGLAVMPGDTLVVPAQIDRETRYNFVTRALRDWSQIFLNFGLGTAALKTLKSL